MAHRKGTSLVGTVASLIDEEELVRDAKQVGYVQRERKQNALAFVWTLILGSEGREERTMAGLHASYNLASASPVGALKILERFAGAEIQASGTGRFAKVTRRRRGP